MLTLIKNAEIINEGKKFNSDILIKNQFISKIENNINLAVDKIIDAKGLLLLPGVIDDQVHFRDLDLLTKEIYTLRVRLLLQAVLHHLWKCLIQIHKY